MNVKDALVKSRSYRRFYQDQEITEDELRTIVKAARLSPSGRNIQPLKFYVSNDREKNSRIFETLAWAGYLKDWPGPVEGERPSAYIVELLDRNIAQGFLCDDGICAQSMLLQAVELGYGGCMIASVKKEELARILELPEHLSVILVIALGKPKEKVVLDEMRNGEYRYWREEDGTHHVPKRPLDEILLR